jgi:general L-amino acid transport system permease protein
MAVDIAPTPASPPSGSWLYNARVRSIFYQVVLVLVVGFLLYEAASNAAENLRRANIASGFGFLDRTAGFSINFKLISYSETSTYGRAFLVGLLNTLLVSGVGIVLATVLGFLIGIARLSGNFVVSRLAYGYVELIRNIPLLLQLVFWYTAVLQPLPNPRNSVALPGEIYLNNRGVVMPRPIFGEGFEYVVLAFFIGVGLAIAYYRRARLKQEATGEQSPILSVSAGLIIGLPLLLFLALGSPLSFDVPQLRGFNFQGGMPLYPEFVALLVGLTLYTAAFIAEIVRSGIAAVSRGQTEAAYSLGLKPGPTLRLIVIPQALRIIIPPLTSQYLNLTKNSSLAVAIGYPDLVQIFAGTVLNQTGQAVEVIAITMGVYLTISLVTSAFMNWYNARVALVER